jgi:hypothetical protein
MTRDELVFEVERWNLAPAPYGAHHMVSEDDEIVLPNAHHGGLTFALSVVNLETAKRLRPTAFGSVGMSAREACEMVLKTELDGLLIQAGTAD